MASKASIHSSHSSNEARNEYRETTFDEKKAASFYDEEVEGVKTATFVDEDSPIEEVRAVVPK